MDTLNHKKNCQDIAARPVLQEFEEYLQGVHAADADFVDKDLRDFDI
jgi:hypothetical protein